MKTILVYWPLRISYPPSLLPCPKKNRGLSAAAREPRAAAIEGLGDTKMNLSRKGRGADMYGYTQHC